MKITRISRHPRQDRVRIHLDDEPRPRLELALDLLLRSGLAVGDRLDPERLETLGAEDQVYRAREMALRLLSHRARSRAEVLQRLQRQDLDPAAVERTLGWLDERGYLDDAAFAEMFVRDRLRLRPRGRTALLRELRQKGVDPATAEAATDAVLSGDGVDEAELTLEAARAWARRNDSVLARAAESPDQRRKADRRLYGHLARRGFPPAAIRAAIARILKG